MTIEYTIVCDGCMAVIQASSSSAAVAREEVRYGGGRTSLPGGRDFCGDCASEPTESGPAAS